MKKEQSKIPDYIKCPNCSESIKMSKICSLCDTQVKSLINCNPEIFHETVFDRLNPVLENIKLELDNLKKRIDFIQIRGMKTYLKK